MLAFAAGNSRMHRGFAVEVAARLAYSTPVICEADPPAASAAGHSDTCGLKYDID